MTKLSLSFVLVTALCLVASTSALPFGGGRAQSTGNQNRRPSRGGGMQQKKPAVNDEESSRISLDDQELAPIVDLISTSRQPRALTVPKIGAAAAALYGVADVGSRIIVNTSGATAPVIMAAGAAGALVTGVWAGGMKQPEKQRSLERFGA